MVATTSSTTAFNMDVDAIIEMALKPVGGEHTSGQEALDSRTVLNLLLIKLSNKNIPLSKLDTIVVPLVDSTASYTLDGSVNDVLDAFITQDSVDLRINRFNVKQFQAIPNKASEGRPTTYQVERNRDACVVNLWPVPPDSTTYSLKLIVSKKIEDITAAYQKIDLPARYLPLVVNWLSYELAFNRPGFDKDVLRLLEQKYKEQIPDTFEEDRERTDLVVRPGGIRGRK